MLHGDQVLSTTFIAELPQPIEFAPLRGAFSAVPSICATGVLGHAHERYFPFKNLSIVPSTRRSIWWSSSKPYYAIVLLPPSSLGALPPLGRDSGDSCCLYLSLAQMRLTTKSGCLFNAKECEPCANIASLPSVAHLSV